MMNPIAGRFEGQVVLVVGGAQGIGKAIAARLAREGAHLMIADIDRPLLDRTKKELVAEGGSVRTVVCDVRRRSQVERTVTQVIRWHERIDVLMYVAGVSKGMPFIQADEKLWDWVMNINLRGGFLFARAVAPQMIKHRR